MSTQRPVPPRPLPRGSPSPGAGGPSQSPATRGRGGAPAIPERRRPDPPAIPARTPPPIPPHHKAVPKPSKATEPAKQPLPQAPAAHATRPAPPKPTRSQAHVQAQPKPEEQQQPQQPKQPQQQQHHQQEHHHEEKHQQQQQEQQQQQQPQGEQPQAAENPAENKGGALPPKIPTGPKPMLRKKHSTVGKPPPPKPPAKKTAAAAVREAEEQPRQAAAPQATNPDGTPMTKRDQIAREILTTERTFVDLLQIALKEYYLPLLKSQPQIIPMDKLNTIFGNMRDVLHTNTILLNDLEDKMKDWGPQQKIGDAFAKLAPFLKIYTLYVSNFDNATATLDACEKIPAFAAFLEACHDKPDCRGQPLASLLILPVQRIPVKKIK